MNELQQQLFEQRLGSIVKGLQYPRTPDVAREVMARLHHETRPRLFFRPRSPVQGRLLTWSLAILLVLCSSLMLIPPARAAIIEFIQIGVVRIFGPQSPPPAPVEEAPSTMIPLTAAPDRALPRLIPVIENLAGEMSLEEAQQAVDYPILLPSYPPPLGNPHRVFVQDTNGTMTILVWLDRRQPGQVLMSLHFIPEGSWAIEKSDPMLVQETSVNGQRAIWTVGPYAMKLSNGDIDFMRLVDGHVLIWEQGTVTYRLETNASLEEAIKIAESLEPIR